MRSYSSFRTTIRALLIAAATATAANAADRFWITPTGGSFGTPGLVSSNWSTTDGGAGGATAPTTTDIANFTLNNTYDVIILTDVTNQRLDVENGTVTFDLNNHVYTLTLGIPIGVGLAAGQTGRLTINEGTLTVGTANENIQIGQANDSTGFLTIAAGGRLGTSAGPRPVVVAGSSGTGTLTVQNDGAVFASLFTTGFQIGSVGTANITGPQASVDANSFVTIGDSGTGSATFSAGADFTGTGTTAVGQTSGSVGTLTITGAGSTWTQATTMTVGSNGVGTLNVQSAGSLTTGTLQIGSGTGGMGTATVSGGATASTQIVSIGSNGAGTLNVTGANSSLTNNGQTFTVGSSGRADVTVSSGGGLTVGQTVIANSAGSIGRVSVSGSTSSLTNASGTFAVGVLGDGRLDVTAGGSVNSGISRIASSAGGVGNATVSGAGSTWTANTLTVGGQTGANGGAGTLSLEAGGTVLANTVEIRNSAGSSLTIDGGTIETGNFVRVGTFNFRDGLLHDTGLFDNASAAAAPLVVDSATAGGLATLRLSNVASVSHVSSLTVGSVNKGALILDGGRMLDTGNFSIAIGAGALSNGNVSLDGTGTTMTTNGTLAVGGSLGTFGGTGVLNIGPGAGVVTSTLNLFSPGTININGGVLEVKTLGATAGHVNFNSGQIYFNSTLSLFSSQLDALLGPGHVIGFGKQFSVDNLTLEGPVTVDGGLFANPFGMTNESTIIVSAGKLDSGITNNSAGLIVVSGSGELHGAGGFFNLGAIQLDNNLVPTSGAPLSNFGTLRGSGFIGNNLLNSGQVQVTAGNRLEFQGATNNNSGVISLIGGEIVFTGTLTNAASTGLISGRDAILRTAGVTNNGSLAFTAGQMDVYGDITNNTGGRITVSGGGIATFYDDVTIAAGASNVQATAAGGKVSTVVFFGSYNGGVSGGGTAFIEGDHRPGNSPAIVSFGGALAYGALSSLHVEVGGTTRGTQYDGVDVIGAAQLGGTLAVDLIDLGSGQFSPSEGQTFVLLNATGGVLGAFDHQLLPALFGGLHFDLSYAANTVTLNVGGVLGDYNLDGTVNAADYTVWRNTLGQMGNGLVADGNNNHLIDTADYTIWKSHFGNSHGSGAGTSSTAANVPEPGTLLLSALVAVVGFSCRLRRSRLATRPE